MGKVFVGGLAWATSDEGLREAFERFGDVVDAKVIVDRDTGRSRGFGFVTFGQGVDTDAVIGEMNGTNLDGRTIRVDKANERPRRGGGGGGGGYGGGGHNRW